MIGGDQSTEIVADTLMDAEAADASVRALVEILERCEAGTQLTAVLFVGLLRDVRSHLVNVVDGLQVIDRRNSPA